MLSTTKMPRSPSAQSQTQLSAALDASTSSVSASVGSASVTSRNSPKTAKNEQPFASLSPDQIKIEEDKNGLSNNDKTNIANPSGSSTSGGGGNKLSVEGQPSSVSGATPILRQNSTSSLNSPNNLSEHSNSSSVSAAINNTPMAESDLSSSKLDEKKVHLKEEDGEIGSSITKATATGLSVNVAIKEEPNDVLNSLVNMKKEERDNSPNMSPVGFGSIAGNAQDTAVKTVKTEMSTTNSTENTSLSSLAIHNNDELAIESPNCNNQMNSDLNNESLSNTPISSILPLGSGGGIGQGPGIGNLPGAGNMVGNQSSGGSNNCLDYMQQQNHIFVFSTQLANKGAESVLSGQFQTIIAYHCTQPATKNFLEDFFMKNPLKMNKLQQRHTTLGMPWIGVGPGPTVALSKQAHKPPANLLKNQYNPGENKRNAFIDPPDPLTSNENDLMCWESGCTTQNSRNNNIEVTSESQAIKILEAAGVDLGQTSSSKGSNINDPSHESNIVSLQGVKVPDENLTPQQRQHREEQLAKIKKMNQFLFPENENAMGGGTKTPNELMIMQGGSGAGGGGGGGSIINSQMRQLKAEPHIMTSEDVLLPGDVISDIGSVIGCGQKNNLQCGGPGSGLDGVGGTPTNSNLMINSSDLMASFSSDISKELLSNQEPNLTQPHSHQPGGGLAQMEWSKIQQQFFEERLKGGKVRPVTGSQQQQSSNPVGNSSNNQQVQRSLQGPPPPYHSTQRSASVPIATQQSPNPSSPNNLSLPSPRTTTGTGGATGMGLPTNSPNMESTTGSGLNVNNPQAIVASSGSQQVSGVGLAASKNCFQTDPQQSPPNQIPPNRTRNNLNSNPSTPLSHLSPKEMESFGQTAGDTNIKSQRPSPSQGGQPKSPSGNSLIDVNIESRFAASSSPGVIFNTHPPHPQPHPHMQSNANSALNAAYKANTPNIQLERQISGASVGGSVQFARRSDNIPLNPNSGGSHRPSPQNKMMTQTFDPISSLAQMSQQLTGCVSSMGGSPGGGGAPPGGLNMNIPDMNMEHTLLTGLDAPSSLDALNQNNSCHPMNPAMTNSMSQQRLMNPKMCGPGPNFNPNSPNGHVSGPLPIPGPGASPANFQGQGGVPPGARLMGRMPLNFGSNFNPNIQVKASTPNTIQYMPVRPQHVNNNNNNSNNNNGGGIGTGGGAGNVRMPPSLEFLQRYANPQMAGGSTSTNGPPIGSADGGPGIIPGIPGMMVGPSGSGSMLLTSPNEHQQQKMGNNSGNTYFQNCNQQLAIMDEDGGGGLDPGMIIGHQPSMIRGMRPHNSNMLRANVMGPRLQQASVNRQLPFTPHGADLDCSGGDSTPFFNSASGQTAALFTASQQQQSQQQQSKSQLLKTMMPAGMCQNHGGVGQMQLLQGQGPGTNNNNINVPSNGGIVSNVNFVGPSSNDLKYAQQYHSFQQQLYATNTRSQQQQQQQQMHQQQQQQGNMLTMPPNLSPNPAFFVNK